MRQQVIESKPKVSTSNAQQSCRKCMKKQFEHGYLKWNHEWEWPIPPIVQEVLRSPGKGLDRATRAFMEPRFKHDFSQVRIHTDAKDAKSARALNANAYAFMGKHIVFASDKYKPHTTTGDNLIAHELAHIVEQSMGTPVLQLEQSSDEPSCPDSTLSDFCQPFASLQEARRCRQYLLRSFIQLDRDVFGNEVASLWQNYLSRMHGASLQRTVISSPSSQIVRGFGSRKGFANSVTTMGRQRELIQTIKRALQSNCPVLPPNEWTEIPLSRYLTSQDLEYPINFNQFLEIPGHIAGGVGSSDAGADLRRVSGNIMFLRSTNESGRTTGIRLRSAFDFLVQDAIDFCPGDPGGSQEQGLTTLLSRLEATGLFLTDEPFAYDMPFEVRYSGDPIEEDIDISIVARCFPDIQTGPVPPSQPAEPEPEPPAEERPEDRER